jgi:hypothetical protein
MTERIKEHVDNLLKNAPRTRRIVDLHEELLSGCLDKYADLTASGASEEDAYNEVVSSIGDINELIGATKQPRSNAALIGAASSAIWPLAALIYLWLGFWWALWHPGWLVFIGFALIQLLIVAALAPVGRRVGPLTGALYVSATLIFLIFGFWTMHWAIACLVFVFAVAVQQVIRLISVWRNMQ